MPSGIPKSNTAAEDDPEFTTVAGEPGESVVVVPATIVAAVPSTPCGISKSKIAADDVPEFVTRAGLDGLTVVVVPAVTVAASPGIP
jgi:hypothetical protein